MVVCGGGVVVRGFQWRGMRLARMGSCSLGLGRKERGGKWGEGRWREEGRKKWGSSGVSALRGRRERNTERREKMWGVSGEGVWITCCARGVSFCFSFYFFPFFSFLWVVKEIGFELAWPNSSFSTSLHLFPYFVLNYSIPIKSNKIK